MTLDELEVKFELAEGAKRRDVIAAFEAFEAYEVTHLIGASDIVAYLKAATGPLSALLEILKFKREGRTIQKISIKAGPDRSIDIERFQIDDIDDIQKFAETLLEKLSDDPKT